MSILKEIRSRAKLVQVNALQLLESRSKGKTLFIQSVELEANTELAAFAEFALLKRLNQKSLEGRYGFYNPKVCTPELLKEFAKSALDRGQYLDAAIFSLMVYVRQQGGK
ncbi:hypothetical protein [Vibrio phage vB_VpaS_VP-RY-9]|nr:hypothetical protein [Vibrio phage vB_VpaS_VP-RY-9]